MTILAGRYGASGGARYPVWRMVLNVILLILPPVVGFWGLFDVWNGFISVAYLGGVLLYLLVIAPWITCTNCKYYGQICPFGLGKLSAAMYNFSSGNDDLAARSGKLFWVVWYSIFPAVFYVYFLGTEFRFGILINFVIFVAVLALFWANSFMCCIVGDRKGICALLSHGEDA